MSGVMRLYAAILQSGIPRGSALPHPHGVEHGWAWFSGILNIGQCIPLWLIVCIVDDVNVKLCLYPQNPFQM